MDVLVRLDVRGVSLLIGDADDEDLERDLSTQVHPAIEFLSRLGGGSMYLPDVMNHRFGSSLE